MTAWSITGGGLTPAQVAGVLDLAAAAAAADSVAPLSEHVLLHLRYDAAGPSADPAPGRDLLLTVNEEIAGYAYLDSPGHPGLDVSGELVIHPRHRGHGLGLALRARADRPGRRAPGPALGPRGPARGGAARPGGRLRALPRPVADAPARWATRWTSPACRPARRCARSVPARTKRSG